ncbi:MAG: LPS export ABC transporter periplasmic protein LptC [Sporomusaceae bacterium]|nr:LPS export ABC transporter periplasmic protein LptC [Sporomusaceae bacterium]
MNPKAWVIGASICIVLGGGLYYFLKDEMPAAPPRQATTATPKESLTFAGNQIVEEENGRRIWELTAEAIAVDPNTQNITLKKVQGAFYSADGKILKIVSQDGIYDSKTKNIVLSGDVKGTSSDGGEFTAPRSEWQDQTKKFYASGGIRVVKDDTVLTGDEMESETLLKTVKVTGHAHMVSKGGQEP